MIGNSSNHCARVGAIIRSVFLAAIALAIVLAVPGTSRAQVLYGTVVGNVKDPTGAVIPDATISLTQTQTGLTRAVQTDSHGSYTASTLPAGTYSVRISAKGFKTFVKSDVAVAINTVTRVDATLQIGAVNQTVEVSASAAVLQTDRADVHHDLSAVQIENIPMAPGNNFEHLFQALPGVTPPANSHSVPTNPTRSLAFNSNGGSDFGNTIMIDGVTQWNIWVPEDASYIPSSDAIETVNVSTNNYNIDQGFAGGAAANVQIKSGTNQIHGDVYEYNYTSALEALPFFAPQSGISSVPKDVFNQFGASVGGPIKKNKLFYFSNVEFTRDYQYATTVQTIPDAAMRVGDLRGLPNPAEGITTANPDVVYDPATGNSKGNNRTQIFATNDPTDPSTYNAVCHAGDPGSIVLSSGVTECPNVIPTSRISPTATALLNMMPQPNIPSSSNNQTSNNYLGAADVHFNRVTTDDKINWNATDKFTMYGHIGYLNFGTLNPTIFGTPLGGPQASGFIGNEGEANGHTITFAVTGNYVATPNFVIDTNFGMTRQVINSQQLDIAKDEGQALGIPGTNGSRPFEGSMPQFSISGFAVLGTQHNFMPYYRNDPQFSWSTNASWIHGNHSLRFGGAIEIQHLNQQQPEWNAGGTTWPAAGGFGFGGGVTQCGNCSSTGKTSSANNYNNFASFLLGVDNAWGRNIQIPDFFHTVTHMYALYVGDTYQVTNKLTATYGVRWEYYPFPTRSGTPAGVERYDFSTGLMLNCGEGGNPIDCGTTVGHKYFSPRIGLAYRMTNNFVVRAGYGMSYEPFNLIDDLRTNYPILIPLNEGTPNSLTAAGVLDSASLQNTPAGECAAFPSYCFGSGGTLPVGILAPPLPSLTSASNPIPGNVNLVTATDHVTRGYIQSWNFMLERQLPGGWLASAGYVGTRIVNQLGIENLNVQSPIAPAGCTPGVNCGGTASEPFNFNGSNKTICPSAASTNLGCRTGGTSIVTPIASGHYDSLQATLRHHWANGFDVGLAYTWSKTIGEAGGAGGTVGFDEKSQLYIPAPAFYSLNHGLAPSDRPQNFEATFIVESPFGAGHRFAKTGFAGKVLGGWQTSGLLTSVSGTPFQMTASGTSLNASGNSQRPDRLCSNIGTPKNVGAGEQWFDPTCFSGVDTQRFGTSAFYVLHGPHLFNLDAALTRKFRLSERFQLQFRAQALNFTNTPHFNNPAANCGSIPSGATSGCSSANFGQITSGQGTVNFAREGIDARQFEFSARLSF
ncbi:MAG TPA: TonB-dependent receptor [Terriglobia bacterium]|nr:TonB-dependent receptor [Terriglobia bacterium]